MTINTLAAATIFQQQLDKIAVQDAVTGWMDANAGQVKYNGGAEVKIPKMSVQGMGDYDRDNGYQQGSVTLEYETRKMTQDRGRKFQIDPMDFFIVCKCQIDFCFIRKILMGQTKGNHILCKLSICKIKRYVTCFF